MNVPILGLGIDVLNTGARRNDEVVGGFGDVAAMMEPIGIDVGWELLLDLTGMQIAAREDTAIFTSCQRRAPHESLNHHQVLWRLITRVRMFGCPQLLAIGCVDTQHLAIAASIQHNIFVDDQAWTEVEVELIAARDWFSLPNAVAVVCLRQISFSPS